MILLIIIANADCVDSVLSYVIPVLRTIYSLHMLLLRLVPQDFLFYSLRLCEHN